MTESVASSASAPHEPASERTATALKEWATICHALLAGEQIIDIRKGGLREDQRHFEVRTTTALLYPTSEHQRAELLDAAYAHWIDLAPGCAVGNALRIDGLVEITDTVQITEAEQLDAITSKVIWNADYARSRFSWKRRDPLWVLVMRAYRLPAPIEVAWDDAYGGCTSWVDLNGVSVADLRSNAVPALSDDAFSARRKGVLEALGVNP